MCIGDNFNDLEMLEYAGTPVVMGNASPELLERAEFYTTLSNDENGVAAAIEKFILKDDCRIELDFLASIVIVFHFAIYKF